MAYVDYFFAVLTSFVMRGLLPAEMWAGLPYTMFSVDGEVYVVANECSGKMLFFYLVVIALLRGVCYSHKGWWKLFVASIPLTVLFNAIRCYVVMKWATGPVSHDLLGFIVYACVMIPCYLIPLTKEEWGRICGKQEKESGEKGGIK